MLSWKELALAMLWDIPILFMALFGKFMEDLNVLKKLLDSPPAQFLELGTDLLLTGYFRGGVEGEYSKRFVRRRRTKTEGGYSQGRR